MSRILCRHNLNVFNLYSDTFTRFTTLRDLTKTVFFYLVILKLQQTFDVVFKVVSQQSSVLTAAKKLQNTEVPFVQ